MTVPGGNAFACTMIFLAFCCARIGCNCCSKLAGTVPLDPLRRMVWSWLHAWGAAWSVASLFAEAPSLALLETTSFLTRGLFKARDGVVEGLERGEGCGC